MLKKILIGIAALIVLLIVFVALQPAAFSVTRSATIDAPPAVVFAEVNDLHKFQAWSPWAKRDPSAKLTFAGPESGTGSSFTWAGNEEVGEGRMTVVESRPSQLVRFKLDFLKPFESTAMAELTFKPEGNRTLVTWTMTGDKNFVAKAIHLVLDMDKMIGGDFEKGLADLKSISEAASKA